MLDGNICIYNIKMQQHNGMNLIQIDTEIIF